MALNNANLKSGHQVLKDNGEIGEKTEELMQVENSDWKNESSMKVRIKKKSHSVKEDGDENSPSWF